MLDAAPDADVVVISHVGFERYGSVREIWSHFHSGSSSEWKPIESNGLPCRLNDRRRSTGCLRSGPNSTTGLKQQSRVDNASKVIT